MTEIEGAWLTNLEIVPVGLISTVWVDWLRDYQGWLWGLGLLSIGTFVFSLVALPLVIVRLPADYFVSRPLRDWPARRPALHLLLVVLKNMLGYVFVVAGVAMLVLPGQGLLTILIGVMLLDFPGKRRLERRIIQIPRLMQAANWMRVRYGQPPFVPGDDK